MTARNRRALAQRLLALALALAGVPAALSLAVFLMDDPIAVGEPSPRTIVAPDLIRVSDPVATDRARRLAAEEAGEVVVPDRDATAAVVQQVRDAFAAARDVRSSHTDGGQARRADQVAALTASLTMLDERGAELLLDLSDDELATVASESLAVAQQFARQRVPLGQLQQATDELLDTELAVRSFPPGIAESVVEPIIRSAVRPTVRVDEDATRAARQDAAAQVDEVVRTYPPSGAIVTAGDLVDEVQMAALQARGLEGAVPWLAALRAFGLSLIGTLAICAYLRAYRRKVWCSTRRLVLLATLFTGFALVLEAVTVLAPSAASGWRYLIPAAAVAMLATILFDPPIGVLSIIPTTALVAFVVPGESGVVAFSAVSSLLSIPLVSGLSARGELRRAAWQSTLLYAALAGTFALLFTDVSTARLALLAGLLNGIVTAMLVTTSLPFLESLFRIVTAAGLLDLADRNHPLLRELEQKALGSYNHSIVVATMVERAARAIGADPLLASVAALYHDIGKVRRPWFFVENQFGIANPHDELEPEVSAVIIQEHVTDGISMARSYRLPPEVVEGIATHHGTTLVPYFHRTALASAPAGSEVDAAHYRYKGRKPSSREMAVLMLADCCEGASRAAAQNNRNLTRSDLELLVRSLIAERVDDGQLDESALTFADRKAVTASFIDTLVGVYHPRIAYPPAVEPPTPQVGALEPPRAAEQVPGGPASA